MQAPAAHLRCARGSESMKDNSPSRLCDIQMVPTAQVSSTAELCWHYEFSLAQKQRLEAIREAVADAFPISQDDWEDGFRKDASPGA